MLALARFVIFATVFTAIPWEQQANAQSVITTIAGTDWLFPGDGKPAIDAPLGTIFGLDVQADMSGNTYICDPGNGVVMRVGPDGIDNVVAGNGYAGISTGDGGLAVNAALNQPLACAISPAGDIFIGEYGGKIRRVTSGGLIDTIATLPTTDTNFPPEPHGIALDTTGNVFVSEVVSSRVYKISPNGSQIVYAGGGNQDADGILATSAILQDPARIALDNSGDLYIADTDHGRIRKVDVRGIISTVAGTLSNGSYQDGIAARSASMYPTGLAVDAAGDIYIADLSLQAIRKIDTAGVIRTIAGGSGVRGFAGDGGPAAQAQFSLNVSSLAIDASGNIYVADDGNARIRKITLDRKISTIAGNGLFRFSGDGGLATNATLNRPDGLAADSSGNLFFTEPSRIREISKNGLISVTAGTGRNGYSGDGGQAHQAEVNVPLFLAIAPKTSVAAPGSLVFADSTNGVIRQIDAAGAITTIAGGGTDGFGPEPAQKAAFFDPAGVDFDSAGNLYITEALGNRVRVLYASGKDAGTVQTLVGDGKAGYSGDGLDVTTGTAEINFPEGLRVRGNNLYFAELKNNVIRKVSLDTHIITTVAGTGVAGFSGDGGRATAATLNSPISLNFDAQGNMYIADMGNHRIRKVDANGTITTVAGTDRTSDPGDGGSPLDAHLDGPRDIIFDSSGDLIFTDQDPRIGSAHVREVLFNTQPLIGANPATLSFVAAAGSPKQTQTITLSAAISGVPFSLSTDSPAWLSISSTTGRMPAEVQITVDPSTVPASAHTGQVVLSAPNASPSSLVIKVEFTVTAAGAPSLAVSPSSFTFPQLQGGAPQSRVIYVSNNGGGTLSYQINAAFSPAGSWLKISKASGMLSAYGSDALRITADPANLPSGTYSGTITVATTNAAQKVILPVTMTVTAVPQTILVPQTGLSFFAVAGGGAPAPQYFNILNTGLGQMPWATSATTNSGGAWLSAFPGNGETDAGSSIVPQVRVDVFPAGLNPGTYSGLIKISSQGATNTPQFVSVLLTVLPPGSPLPPVVQPVGLIFTGVAGGESPGSQSITIQTANRGGVSFTSGIVSSGTNWLTAVPSTGSVLPSQPARILMQPKIDGLSPGVYYARFTLSFSDGSNRTISVILVLTPQAQSVPQLKPSHLSAAIQGPCTPTQLAGVFTLLPDNFNLPVGYPGQVAVNVTDDCSNPMTTGDVVVSFSNGDVPQHLSSLKDGNWAGSWSPLHGASQVTLTAKATVPEQNLTGTFSITGALQGSGNVPVISPGGIGNAASGSTLISPGSLVSVYGSNLAQGLTQASALPLPQSLGSSSLVIAGQELPLLFASNGQINAVVPYGLPVNTQQAVIAELQSTISAPQNVTLAAAAPGIFIKDAVTNQGAITNVLGQLSDVHNPVHAGDAILIYCTGLGEVTPSVAAGSPGPSTPPFAVTTNPVTVTIGGVPVQIIYAGLAPGEVIYQVNAIVPSGLPAGDQVPVVVSAAGQASAPVNIAIR